MNVNPIHVHQCLKLMVTTQSVIQPNAYLFGRPTSAVNDRKPRNAEANVRRDDVRISPAMPAPGIVSVVSNCFHTHSQSFASNKRSDLKPSAQADPRTDNV